uniref:Uncharacterized protein n=1 Tax=Arundo donax TaxID=35708 RepID=A0A0A9GEX8_ARUDO
MSNSTSNLYLLYPCLFFMCIAVLICVDLIDNSSSFFIFI